MNYRKKEINFSKNLGNKTNRKKAEKVLNTEKEKKYK